MSLERHRRRDFLLRALACAGTPALLSACKPSDSEPAPREYVTDQGRLASSFFAARDLGAAGSLGSAFLSSVDHDQSERDIAEACARTIALIDAAADDEAAITALARALREDFLSEPRTLDLEGWVLARTELELCALTLLP